MRILIVDDEQDILNIVSTFLRDRGYETVTATNGDEALKVVSANSDVGVVLLDVVMPGRNGIETLKELMRLDPKPHVIMMTARADEKIFEAVRLGAVDYVLKPIDFEALAATTAASFKRSDAS
jgi:DNA-binding response OmpR family regulator